MYLKSRDNNSANIPGEFFVHKFPCVFTLSTSGYIQTQHHSQNFFCCEANLFVRDKKFS